MAHVIPIAISCQFHGINLSRNKYMFTEHEPEADPFYVIQVKRLTLQVRISILGMQKCSEI